MGENALVVLLQHAPESFTWEQLEVLSLVSKKVRAKAAELLKIRSWFFYSQDKDLRYHRMVRLAAAADGAFNGSSPVTYDAKTPEQVKIGEEIFQLPSDISWAGTGVCVSVSKTHVALCAERLLPETKKPFFALWKRGGSGGAIAHRDYPEGALFPHIYQGWVYLFSAGKDQIERVELLKPQNALHFKNLLGYAEEGEGRPTLAGVRALGNRYLLWYHARDQDPGDETRWTDAEFDQIVPNETIGIASETGHAQSMFFAGNFVASVTARSASWTDYSKEQPTPFSTNRFEHVVEKSALVDGAIIVKYAGGKGVGLWQADFPRRANKRKADEAGLTLHSEPKRKKES